MILLRNCILKLLKKNRRVNNPIKKGIMKKRILLIVFILKLTNTFNAQENSNIYNPPKFKGGEEEFYNYVTKIQNAQIYN